METENALGRYLTLVGMSCEDFAARVGANRSQIYRLTKGQRGPSVDLAVAIERETAGLVPVECWVSVPTPPPVKRRRNRAA